MMPDPYSSQGSNAIARLFYRFRALPLRIQIVSGIILLLLSGSAAALYLHTTQPKSSDTNSPAISSRHDSRDKKTSPSTSDKSAAQSQSNSSSQKNDSSSSKKTVSGSGQNSNPNGASNTPGSSGPGSSGGATPDPCNIPSWPAPSCTGVPAGISLRPSGSINATSGQVIENLDITGQVYIGSGVHNVTIRNTRFNGDGSQYWAIQTEGDGSVIADHVTIRGNYLDAGVSKDNVTLTFADISSMTNDGIKVGSNSRYEHNWIHDFRPAVGAHSDGMQIFQREANVIIRYNYIDAECAAGFSCVWNPNDSLDQSTNAALILSESINQGTAGPITVDKNLLAGGGYTLYLTMPSSVTTFTNNVFARNSYRWGPIDDRAYATTWSNNTYSDNGQIINHF